LFFLTFLGPASYYTPSDLERERHRDILTGLLSLVTIKITSGADLIPAVRSNN